MILALGILLPLACGLSACSVVSAARQPEKKDLTLLHNGTHRSALVAEFGQPIRIASTRNGGRVELYDFVDGYSAEEKIGRSVAHGIADIGTLFLWELAGTPIEQHFDGTRMLVQVTYDPSDSVTQVAYLKRPADVEE